MCMYNRTIGAIIEKYKKEEDIITGCVKLCIKYASDYELTTLLGQIRSDAIFKSRKICEEFGFLSKPWM